MVLLRLWNTLRTSRKDAAAPPVAKKSMDKTRI